MEGKTSYSITGITIGVSMETRKPCPFRATLSLTDKPHVPFDAFPIYGKKSISSTRRFKKRHYAPPFPCGVASFLAMTLLSMETFHLVYYCNKRKLKNQEKFGKEHFVQ
jgi:hypothetical protein